MSSVESIAEELRSSGAELVSALQSTGDIDLKAFERLDLAARRLALRLKGSEQLPRQIVNDLYMTAKLLENESLHSEESALVGRMASTLFMTFDLILLGESHEDRPAGMPRIR